MNYSGGGNHSTGPQLQGGKHFAGNYWQEFGMGAEHFPRLRNSGKYTICFWVAKREIIEASYINIVFPYCRNYYMIFSRVVLYERGNHPKQVSDGFLV